MAIGQARGRAPQLGQTRGPGAAATAATSPYRICKTKCYVIGRICSIADLA